MKRLLACFVLLIALPGCGGCTRAPSTSELEQRRTEANQSKLLTTQPPVALDWSLERENINRRTTLWNDENKVSYIYLVDFGKVMAFYTIKGKVSSVNSQITNPQHLAIREEMIRATYHITEGVLPSPAEDGSYGENGDAIFFFTTDGTYVEWKGDYMLADKPLKLTTPPEIQLIETADGG